MNGNVGRIVIHTTASFPIALQLSSDQSEVVSLYSQVNSVTKKMIKFQENGAMK